MLADEVNGHLEVGDNHGGGKQPRHSRGIARVADPDEVRGPNPTATRVGWQGRGGICIGRLDTGPVGDDQCRTPRVDSAQPLERGADIPDGADRHGVGGGTQHGCHGGLRPRLDRQKSREAAQYTGGHCGPVRPGGSGVQQRGSAVLGRQRQGECLPPGLPGGPIAFRGTLLRTQTLQPCRGVAMDRHGLGMACCQLGAGRLDLRELRAQGDALLACLAAAVPSGVHRLGHPDDLSFGAGGAGSRSLHPSGHSGQILPPARRLPCGGDERLLLTGQCGFKLGPAGDDLSEAIAISIQSNTESILLFPNGCSLLFQLFGVSPTAGFVGAGAQQPDPFGCE